MNSQIIHGDTWHRRHQPREHYFRYKMVWLCLDLDELSELNRSVRFFGYNRLDIVSIHDRDYAGEEEGAIGIKIRRLLQRHGVIEPIARITLITLPRVFGYAFNPVSFYRCHRSDGTVATIVAEVRNTFGEKHHYILRPAPAAATESPTVRFDFSKAFYVSPFIDVAGDYELLLGGHEEDLSIVIHLRQHGQTVLSAEMRGQCMTLNSRSMTRAMWRLPWAVFTVMVRIHLQAFQLFLRRKIPVRPKPPPASADTFPARHPGFWHRLRERLVRRASSSRQKPAPIVSVLVSIKERS